MLRAAVVELARRRVYDALDNKRAWIEGPGTMTATRRRRCSMCFEFEALYWARVAEEEAARRRMEQENAAVPTQPAEQAPEEQPQPA